MSEFSARRLNFVALAVLLAVMYAVLFACVWHLGAEVRSWTYFWSSTLAAMANAVGYHFLTRPPLMRMTRAEPTFFVVSVALVHGTLTLGGVVVAVALIRAFGVYD